MPLLLCQVDVCNFECMAAQGNSALSTVEDIENDAS
jgi:hypothetical protein